MNVMIGVETLINGLQNWGFPGVKGRRYNKRYFQLGRVRGLPSTFRMMKTVIS